jgi:uncharacterized protein (TIGR03435 family)
MRRQMIPWFLLVPMGVALWLGTAFGQSFEVATVKPNNSGRNSSTSDTDNTSLRAENISLKQLIERAYGIADYSLSGPAWMGDARFDVAAKQAAGTPKGLMLPMLRSLLTERFRLAVHHEQKSIAGYALVPGKKPPTLHEKSADVGVHTTFGSGKLKGTNVSMADLASILSRQLNEPVQDQTGLPGVFDVNLEWMPELAQTDTASDRLPSIFTAVQEQLGLGLQAQKITVDVLVVDHVERIPTEN